MTVEPATSEWMTTRDVAEWLRMPESTIRYWRHLGKGPKGVRLGRRVVYRRVDVEAWIAEQRADQEERPHPRSRWGVA